MIHHPKVQQCADTAHNLFMKAVGFVLFVLLMIACICSHNDRHHHFRADLPPVHRVSMAAAFDAVEGKKHTHMTNKQAAQAVLYVFAEE
jgi:hypothetical protein